MATDINPDFSFDFGSNEAPVQAAWEFGGVLRRYAALECKRVGQYANPALTML